MKEFIEKFIVENDEDYDEAIPDEVIAQAVVEEFKIDFNKALGEVEKYWDDLIQRSNHDYIQ